MATQAWEAAPGGLGLEPTELLRRAGSLIREAAANGTPARAGAAPEPCTAFSLPFHRLSLTSHCLLTAFP